MKKIVVTEDNFENILVRLQKICDKYKMIKFYKVFKSDGIMEQKQYRSNGLGFRTEYVNIRRKNGDRDLRKYNKFYLHDGFVRVTKHPFREVFETDKISYDAKCIYSRMKPLVHLDLSGSSALVISVGDKIEFLPFGAFSVWTDNEFTRFDGELTIYIKTFIPNILNGKILDLNAESVKRDNEWEEEAKWWHEQYEEDMRREMEEDYGY